MNKSLLKTPMGRFRIAAILEGISFLILLLIAMPLKYMANYKSAVLFVGWAHGLLFITFTVLLLLVSSKYKWSFNKTVFAFLMSVIPFGTFMLDRKLKNEPH